MSLDKKAILKEIEVLIRSIKVHYSSIETEHRIPTIELELITSKIRKLHEKSIIYNHLHYVEEEQLAGTRRNKIDHLIFKDVQEDPPKPEEIETEPIKSESTPNEKPIVVEVKATPSETDSSNQTIIESYTTHENTHEVEHTAKVDTNIDAPLPVESAVAEPLVNTVVESSQPISNDHFKKVVIGAKLGINDRFRFIKVLFGGNGAAMESAIKEIEACQHADSLKHCIEKLKAQYGWQTDNEAVIDFLERLEAGR
jgi:hypothetical protein